MSRRFHKVQRSLLQRSLRRRKRQQELDLKDRNPLETILRLSLTWDSEEGLFAGDALLVAQTPQRPSFA